MLEPEKSDLDISAARSITAEVKSTPLKSESTAYTLESTASCMLEPEKSDLDISAPESVLALRSALGSAHSRRSSGRSWTALACPIVLPTNARSQCCGSGSMGGSLSVSQSAAAGPGCASSAPAAAVAAAHERPLCPVLPRLVP